MIAANIRIQPVISREDNFCPKSTQPANTEITDSRLRIREAMSRIRTPLSNNLEGVSNTAGKNTSISNGQPGCKNRRPVRFFKKEHQHTGKASGKQELDTGQFCSADLYCEMINYHNMHGKGKRT